MLDCVMKEDPEGMTLRVRIQPGASRDQVVGVAEAVLRLRITAPPVEGAANRQCIKFLAKKLRIAKSKITLLKGEHSRVKVLRINGISSDDLEKLLP
ncbi:MAG: YggU family protein [Deltaproteobacteria bacterium]|nr:YggU family protein [Deltaproteobacteria bacterium]